MKIVLSGATGFIGRNLLSQLERLGHEMAVVVRNSSDHSDITARKFFFDGNFDDLKDAFTEYKPELLIHLASKFVGEHKPEDIRGLIESNILLGTFLLEAMRFSGCDKIINTGTSWQHFNDEEYNPSNLYAATKQAFEDVCRYYAEAFGFKVINLALFDTYGEDDERPKILNLLEKTAAKAEVLKMSPGEQRLNLVHIDDVCRAYFRAINLIDSFNPGKIESFSVRSKEEPTLRELVAMFNEANPEKKVSVEFGGRPYRERELMRHWSKGKVLDGWYCQISLAEGLKSFRASRKARGS